MFLKMESPDGLLTYYVCLDASVGIAYLESTVDNATIIVGLSGDRIIVRAEAQALAETIERMKGHGSTYITSTRTHAPGGDHG
jgi:hypothetical protein